LTGIEIRQWFSGYIFFWATAGACADFSLCLLGCQALEKPVLSRLFGC
jgi:hypothetical protein